MSRRTKAREAALQVLFQDDMVEQVNPGQLDEYLRERLKQDDLVELARSLVDGVRKHRKEIDTMIEEAATNWAIDRMATTDRNVIRIAAYEMVFSDTPARVALNEAIEIAKRFGEADSGRFVNGILDRILNSAEESG